MPAIPLLVLVVFVSCTMPLEEQKHLIGHGTVPLHKLSSRAFVETWGAPTYTHREHTQFYPVQGGAYVPRFRVPPGEVPPNWNAGVVSEPALFFTYAQRGELLAFVDDRLVYRERLTAKEIEDIVKMWKYEAQFKTRLESQVPAAAHP